MTGPAAVAALAARLHVSTAAAQAALNRLDQLSRANGGIDTSSAAFAAVAHGLGVTPQQLADALSVVKQAVAGSSGQTSAPSADLSGLARSAGLTVTRLQAGLAAAKHAGGNNAAGVSAFVAATGASRATAQHVMNEVFGEQANTSPAAVAAAVAARLHVSTAAAQAALNQLAQLGRNLNPDSAAFATVAHGLGVTPQQLAAALISVKQSVAGR